MYSSFRSILSALMVLCSGTLNAQHFTAADTLRGSIGPNRAWWDVLHYDIAVTLNTDSETIEGTVKIKFVTTPAYRGMDPRNLKMQIDLDEVLNISEAYLASAPQQKIQSTQLSDRAREFASLPAMSDTNVLIIKYQGKPHAAARAPWDGGLVWDKDDKGRPWCSVACQGEGASLWYPCKDHQSDEPEFGMQLAVTCDKSLMAVANGRLINTSTSGYTNTYTWKVVNPINTYGISFYVGYYKSVTAQLSGAAGKLDYTFWYLDYNEKKAVKLFQEIPAVIKSCETWFGAFPWYADGYQLVEAPYLGMEHQSAIAYGNKYKRGYSGFDPTMTGIGKKFDYILVHETGHEWFGNNVTTKDIADMWVQEGITTYSEALYVETMFGQDKANKYVQAQRKMIENHKPIIANYGVNEEPPGDQYYKGSSVMHMVRQCINDDAVFKQMLQELQNRFGKITSTSMSIEQTISSYSGIDFQPLFDQYLYTNEIPNLAIVNSKDGLDFFLTNCNADLRIRYYFTYQGLPLKVDLVANERVFLTTEASAKEATNMNYYFTWNTAAK
jgi:aminopeptidase N